MRQDHAPAGPGFDKGGKPAVVQIEDVSRLRTLIFKCPALNFQATVHLKIKPPLSVLWR